VAALRDHFMALHAAGPIAGCFAPLPPEEAGADPSPAIPG
jgi:hypothetical protein